MPGRRRLPFRLVRRFFLLVSLVGTYACWRMRGQLVKLEEVTAARYIGGKLHVTLKSGRNPQRTATLRVSGEAAVRLWERLITKSDVDLEIG